MSRYSCSFEYNRRESTKPNRSVGGHLLKFLHLSLNQSDGEHKKRMHSGKKEERLKSKFILFLFVVLRSLDMIRLINK